MAFRFLSRLACGLMLVFIAAHQAQGTTVDITEFDTWYQVDVDELVALNGELNWIDGVTDPQGGYLGDGSELNFSLTLDHAAKLTLVDAGLGGDRFRMLVNGQEYQTSSVINQDGTYIGTDFDGALSDSSRFSFIEIMLNAGVYQINGSLLESALDGGIALNATVGALKVSEVPLPAAAWLLLSALGGLAFLRRRQ